MIEEHHRIGHPRCCKDKHWKTHIGFNNHPEDTMPRPFPFRYFCDYTSEELAAVAKQERERLLAEGRDPELLAELDDESLVCLPENDVERHLMPLPPGCRRLSDYTPEECAASAKRLETRLRAADRAAAGLFAEQALISNASEEELHAVLPAEKVEEILAYRRR